MTIYRPRNTKSNLVHEQSSSGNGICGTNSSNFATVLKNVACDDCIAINREWVDNMNNSGD